ncbi:MAG: hypothetical protein RMM51_12530, partial [Verrucomicrobiae bacterium]|nr:hypothetical protein [Verrucomicrobiae bacterium]
MGPGNNRTMLRVQTNGDLSKVKPGDWISVAGVTSVVLGRAPGQGVIWVVAGFALPFVLHDDDDDGLLPQYPPTAWMPDALAEVYVVPQFDTLGVASHNSLNAAPFVSNLHTNVLQLQVVTNGWGSRSLNANDFWVAYVITCYQREFADDDDPNAEPAALGSTFLLA